MIGEDVLHGSAPVNVEAGDSSAHAGREVDEHDRLGRPAVGVDRLGYHRQVHVAPGPPELTEGGVAGDAKGPRIEGTAVAIEARGVAPHALEGLLHDVVGPGVAHDASSDSSHRRPQPDVHSRQGFAAAGRHLGHHSYLVHLGPLSGFWGPTG